MMEVKSKMGREDIYRREKLVGVPLNLLFPRGNLDRALLNFFLFGSQQKARGSAGVV